MSIQLFHRFQGKIDREKSTIFGVSVVSVGEAKGHGLLVDALTLQQVKQCAETYQNGVKVKMGHGSGVDEIVGFLNQFRIDGTKLVADLHLFKSHPDYGYIFDIASEIPDTFGISIAFAGEPELVGEQYFARCTELYSADIVSEPAANPNGLFKQSVDTPDKSKAAEPKKPNDMTPEQFQEALNKALEPHLKKISELEAKLATKESEKVKQEPKQESLEDIVTKVAEKFAAKVGTAPVAPAPAPEPQKKEEPKTFMQLVDEKAGKGMSRGNAVLECVKEFPAQYADYRKSLSI
jgi:hypothetical protein